MHGGTFYREGTVAELTRTLPAVISFGLLAPLSGLPVSATRTHEGRYRVETQELQKDLHLLLGWAFDNGVELVDLEAGPTRLDDVFRAIGHSTPGTTAA